MRKKSTEGRKAGYRDGHKGRYDFDAEFQSKCLLQGIPRVLLHEGRDVVDVMLQEIYDKTGYQAALAPAPEKNKIR